MKLFSLMHDKYLTMFIVGYTHYYLSIFCGEIFIIRTTTLSIALFTPEIQRNNCGNVEDEDVFLGKTKNE